MTSEYVQRLAEWFGVYRTDEPSASKQSAMRFAQEALDASGATARIEAIEKERNEVFSKYGLETMGGVGYEVLDRHLNGNWKVTYAAQNKTIDLWQERAEKAEKRVERFRIEVTALKATLRSSAPEMVEECLVQLAELVDQFLDGKSSLAP